MAAFGGGEANDSRDKQYTRSAIRANALAGSRRVRTSRRPLHSAQPGEATDS